ncbi:F-box/kelch-repeat protein At3g23880-like [Nicotiana tabacum]|uniref:F-box/kelch-repeat protein At3g23880-like n=1 Tax=Nicotiana tabacum TaxID=4097 RepID=A0A1S4BPN3_TOBAC|nr:PREDICTED: F-box/kelch-repeat protein At3g23880-like [Nicotiana tabacum]
MEFTGDEYPLTLRQDSILTIPILPAELVTEILSKVRVKPLLRFTCVSKSWLALISGQEFIKSHLNLSANNKDNTHHRLILNFGRYLKQWSLKSLLYESVTEASTLYYPMKIPKRSFRIVGSVNGLICLADSSKDLVLWNPSIRKYKKLPNFKTNFWDVSWFVYGFGYDEFRDDYKVVGCFYYDYSSFDVEVGIYSLKSDSWKSICSLPDGMGFLIELGKFVNGKLHWVNNINDYSYEGCNIISIDLVDEKWETVEQPSYEEGDIDLQLGLFGSDLSIYINNEGKHVSVWVMKEYGVRESWTKMFTIKYADYSYSYAQPFFMSNKGEVVVAFDETFMIYNPNDDSLTPTGIHSDGWQYTEIYVKSLVSPFPTDELMIQESD